MCLTVYIVIKPRPIHPIPFHLEMTEEDIKSLVLGIHEIVENLRKSVMSQELKIDSILKNYHDLHIKFGQFEAINQGRHIQIEQDSIERNADLQKKYDKVDKDLWEFLKKVNDLDKKIDLIEK